MDDILKRRIEVGRKAVEAQVDLLHENFGRAESSWKHDGTRVTPIDLKITENIFASLAATFPDDHLCSEENDPGNGPIELTERFAWILDPVDGTNNYAIGIPMVAISLALLAQGEPVYGFVYDMGGRCLYHGGPGFGLWLDDEPLVRREPDEMKDLILGLHSPVDERHMPVVQAVLRGYKVRAHGSGTLHLTNVALGRMDACLDFTIKTWDIAAAVAFCRESGIDLEFLDRSPFPITNFDVRMSSVPYLAARPEIMADLKSTLHLG